MSVSMPLYFGPEERARFGLLDWPDGVVRGAAVVCPPLGYEDVCAHTALRHLAEQLAAAGIATLRVDYDGSGNSVGRVTDPDRVPAWSASVVDAIDAMIGWGLPSITLVGLRFGATLAVAAAGSRPQVGALALWDPVVSGRRYARTMRLFSAAGGNDAMADGGVAVAGVEFDAATLSAMGKVNIKPEQLQVPCLVIARAEAESEAADLAASASEGGAPSLVELRRLTGTRDLLDTDAELSRVPAEIVGEITRWVAARAAAPVDPQPARPLVRTTAHETFGDGIDLEHRAFRVGAAQLLAIETVAAGAKPADAVLMLNNGVARSVGPGGAWVEFGERFAAGGARAVRLDLSGLGDSPVRAGQRENDTYAPTAAADIGELVTHLRAEGVGHIAALGLCSGALSNFDGALAHREIDVCVSINGRFDRPFTDRRRDRAVRAAGQTLRFVAVPLHKTPLLGLFEKVPTWIWRVLHRLHIVASPTVALERAVARDARVVLVFGDDEWGLRALRVRGGRRFRELENNPLVTLDIVDGLDHSMFDLAARTRAMAVIEQRLRERDVLQPQTASAIRGGRA